MIWAASLDNDGSAVGALTGVGAGGLFREVMDQPAMLVTCSSPGIWNNPAPVQCQPPCTIILPPSPVNPTVINWPPITTQITQSGGGTSTTVIQVPPFTISSVSFWPVTIASGLNSGSITPRQSVLPPSLSSLPCQVRRPLCLHRVVFTLWGFRGSYAWRCPARNSRRLHQMVQDTVW